MIYPRILRNLRSRQMIPIPANSPECASLEVPSSTTVYMVLRIAQTLGLYCVIYLDFDGLPPGCGSKLPHSISKLEHFLGALGVKV